MKSAIRFAAQWAAFMVAWVLFVFEFKSNELMAGALASALAVVMLQTALRAAPLCFQPKARWLAQGARLPGMIAQDLWILLIALARRIAGKPSRGVFQLEKFEATGDDCGAAAQRALAVLYISMPPNSFVLDIDRANARIFIHQLEPAPFPEMARKLLE